jgi:hypothetical protein
MKVDHLTANPLKAEREDFVPPLLMKRIEDAAKRNPDLTWALDQASGKQAFSGRHLANSSRGGKAEYARQRGRGGGAPKGAPKGAKTEQEAEEAEAAGAEPALRLERTARAPTRRPTNRRPVTGRRPSGGPWTDSQPDGGSSSYWVDGVLARPSLAASVIVPPPQRFDSTRGFPGEGPQGPAHTPWYLQETRTRGPHDHRRQSSGARPVRAGVFPVAAVPSPPSRRLTFVMADRGRSPESAHTAIGRFLKSKRARQAEPHSSRGPTPTESGTTPLPRESPLQVAAFATPREGRDFRNPLPVVPAGQSLRQAFIKHFGGLRGMDAASFDEVWKVAKNGYNKSHDAHFRRFHTDFLAHSPPSNFTPTGIQPGDLVGFLRREREKGAAHPSLKDTATSVSTACAQASDGLTQLGAQDSVVSFLKYLKQHEAPDRRERMPTYPDVARLIQTAWEFGPNANLSLDQLKHKLVILLMVDTAARPSDIWRLYRTRVEKYRQIATFGDLLARRTFTSATSGRKKSIHSPVEPTQRIRGSRNGS